MNKKAETFIVRLYIVFAALTVFSISLSYLLLSIALVTMAVLYIYGLVHSQTRRQFTFDFFNRTRYIPWLIFGFYALAFLLGVIFTPPHPPHFKDPSPKFIELKELFLFGIFLWTLFALRDEDTLRKTIRIYLLVMIPFMLYGVVQSFTGIKYIKSFANFYRHFEYDLRLYGDLSTAFESAWREFRVVKVKLLWPSKTAWHVSGFLSHHLSYAGYLFLPVFLLAALALNRFYNRHVKPVKPALNTWLIIVILLLVFYNLLNTQSRSALAAVFLGAGMLFAVYNRKMVVVLLAAAVLGVFSLKYISKPVYNRIVKRSFSEGANAERILMFNTSLKYGWQHPFTGIGPRKFIYYYRVEHSALDKELRKKGIRKKFILTKHKYRQPHNEYLNQFVTGGILRALAFVALFVLPFFMLWRTGLYRSILRSQHYIDNVIVAMALFVFSLMCAFMLQSYFSDDKVQMAVWIGYGIFFRAVSMRLELNADQNQPAGHMTAPGS